MSDDIPIPLFQYGEWVECLLTDEFGIVVGSDIHGLIYTVHLAGGALKQFHAASLSILPERDTRDPARLGDNVIDFTKAADLRRAKPRGAA